MDVSESPASAETEGLKLTSLATAEEDSARGDASPVSATKDATATAVSTTSFFFRARPKQVLSSVKRVLLTEETPQEKQSPEPAAIESSPTKGDSSAVKRRAQVIEIPSSSSSSGLADGDDDMTVISATSDGKTGNSRIRKRAILVEPETRTSFAPATVKRPVVGGLAEEEIDPWLLESLQRKRATTAAAAAVEGDVPRSADRLLTMELYDEFPYHVGDRPSHRCEYTITADTSISKLYQTHCRSRGLASGSYAIILTHRGVRLFGSMATPRSLGVHSGRFAIRAYRRDDYERGEEERRRKQAALLEALVAEEEEEGGKEGPDGGTGMEGDATCVGGLNDQSLLLHLRFKSARQHEAIRLSMAVDAPMQSIVPELLCQLDPSSATEGKDLCLVFDGALLALTRTPAELELEDDDLLEVRFS